MARRVARAPRFPLRTRVQIALRDLDTRPIEILYTCLTVGWGSWLLLPGEIFATSKSYRFMASFAPENVWALMAFTIGICRIIGLLFANYPLRILAAWGGCVIWTMTAVALAMNDPGSTGVPVYATLSACCGTVCIALMWRYRAVRGR